jgi:ABC-type multidrug transport system permease subunit
MNYYAIRAIFMFEMGRTFRTLVQSIVSPVLSTSLYFIVFGSAIGSRMTDIDGIAYGAFLVPGLIMLSILTESISNASFGIYFPRFIGTIYEILSAPVSPLEIVIGYVGAAAAKSLMIGSIILLTASLFVDMHILHPFTMLLFLVLTTVTFSMFGFIIGIWADKVSDDTYRFIQITHPEGTFTGPSIHGQPTGRKLGYDNIMNMCECVVKKIDGRWKIVEEWGLLGYSNFFQSGA